MGKRANNEGSIYQMPNGKWRASISLGYQNGKLKRKYFFGQTRAIVHKKLTDAVHAHERNLPVAPEQMTVQQLLERWLQHCVKVNCTYNTHASYTRLTKKHIIPSIGRIRIEKLSPLDLQGFMNRATDAGNLGARSVNYLHAIVRAALEQALKWGLVIRNVAKLVSPPSPRRKPVNPFTQEEAIRFLQAVQGDRLAPLFLLAVFTGLRQGELLGLTWDDFKGGFLSVNRSLQRIDGALRLVDTKTASSLRTLPLPQLAIDALEAHHAAQDREKLWVGSKWRHSQLIFTTKIGTPLDGTNVTKQFRALLEVAGLRRCRFHDLRHTCATLMLSTGVHARTVMEQLGHSQISLTMNTYGHVVPSMSQDAANRMNAIFSAPETPIKKPLVS